MTCLVRMMNKMSDKYIDMPLPKLLQQLPFVAVYLNDLEMDTASTVTFRRLVSMKDEAYFEQRKTTPEQVIEEFGSYLDSIFGTMLYQEEEVRDISIYAGLDKDGDPEGFEELTLHKGEVVAIVGPTGSGKSRLLEDIEWQAEGDTPTGRVVCINGKRKSESRGGMRQQHRIAQLSQNMNFVLDMTVGEFLKMHADCFAYGTDTSETVQRVYEMANSLCGEGFTPETAVTSLSGGQSRALMIADCALLSRSSIVLIDEIENAGIDRREAIKLLVDRNKIVFIATHDPVLALLANKRIVIRGGGIRSVLTPNAEEKEALRHAEEAERVLGELRSKIRTGEPLMD